MTTSGTGASAIRRIVAGVGQVEHAQRAEGAARGRDLEPAANSLAEPTWLTMTLISVSAAAVTAPRISSSAQGLPRLADQQVDHADPGRWRDLVTVQPQDPAEPLAGLRRHVGPAVEHLRDGGDRHAGRGGDAGQAGRARLELFEKPLPVITH